MVRVRRTVVLFAVMVAVSSAAWAADIIPGVGCGKLRLGITAEAVYRMLGVPEGRSTRNPDIWFYRLQTISVRIRKGRVDWIGFSIGGRAGKGSPNRVKGPNGTVTLGQNVKRVIRAFGPISESRWGTQSRSSSTAPQAAFEGQYIRLSYPLYGITFGIDAINHAVTDIGIAKPTPRPKRAKQ